MSVYYNEIDQFAAAWLRALMRAGEIPEGEVDERSIADVSPDDVRGFRQCHWFAGIGGWAYALRLAGWGDEPIWTGSCPCQPFTLAGKGDGEADPRDLWPAWAQLIRECRPVVIAGEQVAAAARGIWLDRLCADLEGIGYAVGAGVLGAHSVGAPHLRQRLWFVADADGERHQGRAGRYADRSGRDPGRGTR
jgi:DNA (cytosine-5)-methyltransferase 1